MSVPVLRLRATPRPLAAALACAFTCLAHAQSLPETVVTATRMATRADDLVSDVRVVDRATIEQSGARSLPELLARHAGVQMSANGGRGKTASVFIRGSENRHTVLLVDGVRVGSATAGTPTWETLPVELIERIEVLKGPASALYGSDAVGGVVQVFTRRGRAGFQPSASLSAGSRGYASAAGGFSGGQGPVTYALSLQRERERGINATRAYVGSSYNPDVDPFRQDSLVGSLGVQLAPGWSFDTGVLHSDGVSHFDDGPRVDARNAVRATTLHTGVRGRVAPGWQTELRWSQGQDTANSIVATFPGAFQTRQSQWTWQNDIDTPLGVVLAGLEQREQHVSATTAYAVTDRTITSAFTGLTGSAGAHSWQANLRRDRNSQFGSADTGFVGYGYRLSPAWRVHASHGTSYVAPSFNQLYFPNFGTPTLAPEHGRNTDAGVTWTGGAHEVRLVRFDNRLRDLIVNASTPAGLRPLNVQRARIEGWSLGYAGTLGRTTVRADLELLDPTNQSTGRQLQRRAREQATLGADHRIGAWRFGASLLAVGRRWDDTANTRALGGYTTADLHADWQFAPGLVLQGRLLNVADKRYETAYGYNQPGRGAYLTLRWQPK